MALPTVDIAAAALTQLRKTLEAAASSSFTTVTKSDINTTVRIINRLTGELLSQVKAGTFEEFRWWGMAKVATGAAVDTLKTKTLPLGFLQNLMTLNVDLATSFARAAAKAATVLGTTAANIGERLSKDAEEFNKPGGKLPWYVYAGGAVALLVGASIVAKNFGITPETFRSRQVAGLPSGKRRTRKSRR